MSLDCQGEHRKDVYTENGITYDSRPLYMDKTVAEPVGSGHTGAIQSAPQMGCSSNGPDRPRTHTDVTNNNDQPISQAEKLACDEMYKKLGQMAWEEIPNEDTPTPGESVTISGGETVLAVPSPPG